MNIDVHFDWKFYLDLYPDLKKAGINTQEKAYQHYINHGKNEGRACQPYCLEKNILEIQNQIKQQQMNFLNKQEKKKEESYFNILIRTSNRPEMFHKCIQSILDQKYTNYKIWYYRMQHHTPLRSSGLARSPRPSLQRLLPSISAVRR